MFVFFKFVCLVKNGIPTYLNLSLDLSPPYHLKLSRKKTKTCLKSFLSEKNGKMKNKQKI